MSFPDKETRQQCWSSRDAYWKCLDDNAPKHSSTSGEKVPESCLKLRKAFESACPNQWVKHFDRKRSYEQFKEKMSKGFDPVEENLKQKSTR